MKEKQKLKKQCNFHPAGISIRMPLLIYGADIPIDEDITMEKLVNIVDDSSWEEFMPPASPKRCSRALSNTMTRKSLWLPVAGFAPRFSAPMRFPHGAGQENRAVVCLLQNPDKETVLTPWRVVNMHMSDCLGGYDFYDETHEQMVEEPRFVDHGKVTADTFCKCRCPRAGDQL